MMLVVLGGSGSGKSAYAEERTVSLQRKFQRNNKDFYYLATMKVYDKEGRKRIEKHRQLRAGKGFITIEQPENIVAAENKILVNSTVLIECLSNLTANIMFKEQAVLELDIVVKQVIEGIKIILQKVEHLIIVTNNVFEDGIQYDEATKQYMDALAKINNEVVAMADEVVEVVVGLPLQIK